MNISGLESTALGFAMLRVDGRPSPRKTRFRPPAKLSRAGFGYREVPMKGFCVRVTSSFLELILTQRHSQNGNPETHKPAGRGIHRVA
jgi:hypothetical protein